jgi:hypothetical protein
MALPRSQSLLKRQQRFNADAEAKPGSTSATFDFATKSKYWWVRNCLPTPARTCCW